jgi:hypothetical protein
MHTKIAICAILFAFAVSCAPRATMQAQPMQTSNLLRDLKTEGCCGINFIPSAVLVEKYNLREDGKTYYASGFLHVSAHTSASDVEKLGAFVGTQIDSMWTVQVPVQNLELLLKTKGVKTFELGRKVQMKRGVSKQLQ